AMSINKTQFNDRLSRMQNPTPSEDYVVISGKHNFQTQRNAVIKKLFDSGVISSENAKEGLVKPELVNLIPNILAGRVDRNRRNISIN
ncbi:hypothetical protein KDA00_03280, partial [Candidatus Saccharibacteria bacterium]|nr:hypothetical protein [Candidatus Saccharibacteria bacterium]